MRIYIKRRCGGIDVISVEEFCAELRSINIYFASSEERLLKAVARIQKLGKDKIESKNDYSSRIEQEKIDKVGSMKLHGKFGRDTDNKKPGKSCYWLRNGSLKRERENLLLAVQVQVKHKLG